MALIAVAAAVLPMACGYRLGGPAEAPYAGAGARVDLRPFRNDSVVADVGALLADRIRDEMLRTGFRGRFGRSRADILIEGRVRAVNEAVWSQGKDEFALEHRLTIVADVRVVEVERGRLRWKEEGLSETASYFEGADFQFTESNRRVAIEEVCRRLATRIAQTLRVIL